MPSRDKTGPRQLRRASLEVAGGHLSEGVLDALVDARYERGPLVLHVVAVGLECLECGAHEALHLRMHRLRGANQIVIRPSSGRNQMVITSSSGPPPPHRRIGVPALSSDRGEIMTRS